MNDYFYTKSIIYYICILLTFNLKLKFQIMTFFFHKHTTQIGNNEYHLEKPEFNRLF